MVLGDLKYQLEVFGLIKTKSESGAESESYVSIMRIKTGVKYISGAKQLENEMIVNTQSMEFTTHYRPAIVETCRLLFKKKYYKINNIAELGVKEGLKINVELIQGLEIL